MEFKSTLDIARAILPPSASMRPPPVFRSRGKVAGTRKTSEVIQWPNLTAAEFGRLPGHEKTAVYFQTCASRLWQARWHHDFLLAFDWFSTQLSIRERNARLAGV